MDNFCEKTNFFSLISSGNSDRFFNNNTMNFSFLIQKMYLSFQGNNIYKLFCKIN